MASNSNGLPPGGGNVTQDQLLTMFREMMQQFAQPAKRELPPLNKIVREEDFPVWRRTLTYNLNQSNLTKYINSDVPQPAADRPDELRTWQEERKTVDNYLRAHMGDTKILRKLEDMGWDPEVINPKSTFDFLVKYFEGTSSDSFAMLNKEFVNIDRAKFASMDAFQSRISYLRHRLKATGSPWSLMGDPAYLWMVLKGIQNANSELYTRAVIGMENNTLTWNGLMEELQKISVAEKTQATLAQVKIDGNPRKSKDNNTPKDNNYGKSGGNVKPKDNPNAFASDSDKERKPCVVCDHMITEDYHHCPGNCGNHIPKKLSATECWWCHPEKARNSWPHKTIALQKKLERQLASTTGPLHQQSGLQNPSTSQPPEAARPALKRVMFQTNLANLSIDRTMLSSFQAGPRRH